jgi:hypothetical protein
MSISDNFEGGLMKAIRSLEQHVDSLMSYDFTGLTDEELLEDLAVVDLVFGKTAGAADRRKAWLELDADAITP